MQIARHSTFAYYLALAVILGGGVAAVGFLTGLFPVWTGIIPAVIILFFGLRKPLRRWKVAQQPFPDTWRDWLEANVPLYRCLEAKGRRRFEQDVQFFIDEHTFEGVKDVEVTDSLKLGVAAGAALLLHGRPDWELPSSHSILFYHERFDDDYFAGDYGEYDGMAHAQGPLIMTVSAVHESWANPYDGDNVVLHELAHLFDFKNTDADGIPMFINPASEATWQELVRKEMQRIRRHDSMLDSYGATAPSEFFAVAVEAFFERPEEMHRRHRELYEAMVAFFDLDPQALMAAGRECLS